MIDSVSTDLCDIELKLKYSVY